MFQERNLTCCFFGHKNIPDDISIKLSIYNTVRKQIQWDSVKTFYFYGKDRFNIIGKNVIASLKEEYPYIKSVYVRSDSCDIADDEFEYDQKFCVKNKYDLIDKSDVCIMYYSEDYVIESSPIDDDSTNTELVSDTRDAYIYAKRKNKIIINIYANLQFTKEKSRFFID